MAAIRDQSQRLPVQARNAARSPLGRISLAGFARNGRGVPFDPLRVLGSYAIVYVVDGGGRFLDETGLDLPVRAGDLLLIFPEVAHGYGPVGDQTWSELWFCFDGPVFDLWRRVGLLDPAQPIRHLEPIEHWFHYFDAILGAPREPGHAPALLEVCRLQEALAEVLLGGAANRVAGAEATWAARACALLEAELERAVDLHELAAELGMSYDGFRKRFRQAVGLPPHRYRSARLIDRACELMHLGALTDREIAERLGFCDEYYFSRRFKEITGQSPRHFRASLPMAR